MTGVELGARTVGSADQLPRVTDQFSYLSAPCDSVCGVATVLEGIFIPLRRARRRSAVHPAATVRHCCAQFTIYHLASAVRAYGGA
jgi:hypothetical protein